LGSELTRTLKGDPLTVNVWLASHAASITSEAVSEHDSVAAAS